MKDTTKNNANRTKKPIILVAPLDWGLGHATRCIPLIKYLQLIDYEVIIASDGPQAQLLAEEFKGIRCVYLQGYELKYAKSHLGTSLKIILQVPKILTAIKREKAWLHSFLAKNQVDGIISDNRYGLFHSHIPSAIITHQLLVKSFWKGIGERWMQRLHYRFIGRFKACWVPDYAGIPNLAGKLSHPLQLPSIPVSYTGPLTRFKAVQVNSVTNVLIILSGPEPQRTILEKMLLADLQEFNEPAIIVRGLPGQLQPIQGFNKVTIYNHLKAEELNEIVNSAQIVISRSGYSTVMDLMTLQKRCIFIPTPGQTEQLYLARYLASGNHCVFYSQGKFSLQKALDEIRNRTLTPFEAAAGNGYEKLLRDLPHL